MDRLFTNTEFFTFKDEVWFRKTSGEFARLADTDYDTVDEVHDLIRTFYPKAFEALASMYNNSARNQSYYRYLIVSRFVRCNFAPLDEVPDITWDNHFNFEHISCPLRGECPFDGIICRPEFDHRLSPAELRVMELVYHHLTEPEIAEQLHISRCTVHNHISNAYARLGIHSKSEFCQYAATNKLF